MQRQVVTPIHLVRLPCLQVIYVPQNLQTTAIQVTRETMGAMSIEFGCEVGLGHPNHRFLNALLERVNPKGDRVFIERTLSLGEWLVVLEDEVHIFPDDLFGSTFTKAEGDSHGFPNDIDLGYNAVAMLPNDVAESFRAVNEVVKKSPFRDLPAELQHQDLPDQTA